MSQLAEFSTLIEKHMGPLLRVPQEQTGRLFAHWELMVRWNRSLNLTTVAGLEESVLRHYCESLFLTMHLPEGALSVLDVGSGPGFPGIPLAIARPDCQVTLVEAHQRKAVFLKEATRSYGNVRVLAKRVDAIETEAFGWVVSRAVRWRDVLPVVHSSVGLLTSAEDSAEICGNVDFLWHAPVPLPWGTQRVLLLGSRQSR